MAKRSRGSRDDRPDPTRVMWALRRDWKDWKDGGKRGPYGLTVTEVAARAKLSEVKTGRILEGLFFHNQATDYQSETDTRTGRWRLTHEGHEAYKARPRS